jgi:hypothetical protein
MLIGDRISPPDPWLDPWLSPLRGYKSRGPPIEEEFADSGTISASVETRKDLSRTRWRFRNGDMCFVKFEGEFLFLEPTGRDRLWIEPKTVVRTGKVTIVLDTGRWNYGKITLTFNSASVADEIEQQARKLVGQHV